MGVGFVVGVFGVLILAHAAYSTIQYRSLLKIMQEEFSGPPFNVAIELILGLVLSMWAALTVPGKFLSINPEAEENRYIFLSICALNVTLDSFSSCKSRFYGLQSPRQIISPANGFEAETLRSQSMIKAGSWEFKLEAEMDVKELKGDIAAFH